MGNFKKNYKAMELSIPPEELDDLIAFLNETQPYGAIDRLAQMSEDYAVIQKFEQAHKDIADDEAFMAGMCCYLITRFVIPPSFVSGKVGMSDVECTVVKPPNPSKLLHDSLESFNAAFKESRSKNYLVLRFDNKRALNVGFVCCKGDGCVYHVAEFRTLSYIWNGMDKDGAPKNGIGPWSQPDFEWQEKEDVVPPLS